MVRTKKAIPAARRNKRGKVPKRPSGPRLDEDRVEAVQRMYDELEEPRRIVRVISALYKVDPTTVQADLRRVRAEIEAQRAAPDPDTRERRLRACLQRFRACVRKGDEKNAKGWMAEINRIEGNYSAEVMKTFQFDIGELQLLSDEEFDAAVRAELVKQKVLAMSPRAPVTGDIAGTEGAAAP